MEFEWDEDKRVKVYRDRGVDLLVAAQIFKGPVITTEDTRKEYGETRFLSIGEHRGEVYVLVHTPRGLKTRLITAWRAGHEQRKIYQERISRRD